MSLQIKVATGMYRGDPGIFGAIGKALGGIAKVAGGAIGGFLSGGPLGAVTGGIKAIGSIGSKAAPVLKNAAGQGTTLMLPISQSSINRINQTSLPGTGQPSGIAAGLQLPGGGAIGFGPGAPDVGINAGAIGGAGYYGPGTALVVRPKAGHLNKSSYFLKDGTFVPAGSKMVANRRMNPLNPHSLSKSIRRVAGFAHATKSIRSQIGKVATQVAPKRHSCGGGCKTRKR